MRRGPRTRNTTGAARSTAALTEGARVAATCARGGKRNAAQTEGELPLLRLALLAARDIEGAIVAASASRQGLPLLGARGADLR